MAKVIDLVEASIDRDGKRAVEKCGSPDGETLVRAVYGENIVVVHVDVRCKNAPFLITCGGPSISGIMESMGKAVDSYQKYGIIRMKYE